MALSTARSEAGKARWASLSPEARAAMIEKAAAGRRRKGPRRDDIAAGRYRAAGLAEREVLGLLALPQAQRKWARKRAVLYGANLDVIARLVDEQGNRCALCLDPLPASCHVDHDHATGRVRGLLCARCNLALGHIEARGWSWVERARTYLTTAEPGVG